MKESQEGISHTQNAVIVESEETNKKPIKMLAISAVFVDSITICIPKTQNNTSKKQNVSKRMMLIRVMSSTIAYNKLSFL